MKKDRYGELIAHDELEATCPVCNYIHAWEDQDITEYNHHYTLVGGGLLGDLYSCYKCKMVKAM